MTGILSELRHAVLDWSVRTGLSSALGRSLWRRNRLLILCYHGVSLADEHLWSDLYVPQSQLDQRLQLLKRVGATVLPLQEAIDCLRSATLPDRAVAITFDDGMHDFRVKAYPVLEAAGVHSTLYLTTYYVDRDMPIFNPMSSYLLWKGGGRTVHLPGGIGTVALPTSVRDPIHQEVHAKLRRLAATLPDEEQQSVAREIATAVHVDFDALCDLRMFYVMRSEEIRDLDPSRVSVQLHTHRHRVPRDEALFAREIHDNRAAIESRTGASAGSIRHFCYPSGEYHPEFIAWLPTLDITSATTCNPGLANAADDPLLLPRFIDTSRVPSATFEAWVQGTGAALAQAIAGTGLRGSR